MFRRTATSAKERSFLHAIKLVSPFVMVVVLQAAIAGFSLEVMSSVRAYVAGEAMWSHSLEEAMRRADAACYRAKEKGRNRVQVDNGRPGVVLVTARREAARA